MPSRILALPAVLLLLAAGPADEAIYTWTDAEGVAHYTNDPNTVPRRYRDKAHALDGQPLPAEGDTKTTPPAETKPAPAEETARAPAPKQVERTDELLEESAPPPAPVPEGGKPLDENAWRKLFLRANERVRRAELNLARDRDALSRVSNEEGYMVVDPYGRTMTAGRATAVRLQVTEDERVLRDAREALQDLERAAAREAIPLEWRR
jgi:hypothetical protein